MQNVSGETFTERVVDPSFQQQQSAQAVRARGVRVRA